MKITRTEERELYLREDELRTLFTARDILSEVKLLVGDRKLYDKWDSDAIGALEKGLIMFTQDVRIS